MAYKVRQSSQITIGFTPTNSAGTPLAGAFNEDGRHQRSNQLKSVNDPLRYQIQWLGIGNEATEPTSANYNATTEEGDLINVLFEVRVRPHSSLPYRTLGTIRKQRDIVNKKYDDQTPAKGHRFTIDVSRLVQNELSYSLCPINKGTWQSRGNRESFFGGMNGGAVNQDNVLGNTGGYGNVISNFNSSYNATFLELNVKASFEIIDGDGGIVLATGTSDKLFPNIFVINSVNHFERDSVYYNGFNSTGYIIQKYQNRSYDFLSRCPNSTNESSHTASVFKKKVRIDEEAEFLQFFLDDTKLDALGGSTLSQNVALKVNTYNSSGLENEFYLKDFENNLLTFQDSNGFTKFQETQRLMFIQNVSPSYINNTSTLGGSAKTPTTSNFPYWNSYTGNRITDDTLFYRISINKTLFGTPATEGRNSNFRYFVIDREDAKAPYEFVRFHWLNSLGGIDSYTAKRDVVEAITVSRDVVERKSVDKTWIQSDYNISNNGDYISDTARGGDLYKGGREVTNVNAEKNRSVYTEPLNKQEANWLQEIFLSPNVWIEMDTDATARPNVINPYIRPSTKSYIPVIITNSDVETVNQEVGLVKFNIEYTLAHKVITQRN
jgi:hypothetical protein